jgi:hypothetical protein
MYVDKFYSEYLRTGLKYEAKTLKLRYKDMV